MTIYNKLVRDNIPNIMIREGLTCSFRELSVEEFERALKAKLLEEVNEFISDGNVEELVDIVEVISSLAAMRGVSEEELRRIRKRKLERAGGFTRRYFLATSD